MSSLGLSGISASSCNDKGHDPVSCRFCTIVLLVVTDLAFLLPYTVRYCTEVVPGCTGVVSGCTAVVRYCKVTTEYYTAAMPCSMVLGLD